ncbi:MAG TPA: UDP-N-acetylglucosamine 2-epimerase, partial [Anaerolineales bacterium]|nr:UDP-N-acetylglucosamine 2-epimerase [Anaerolineales bacterium]
ILPSKIHRVGNIMIDSLVHMLPKARQQRTAQSMGLQPGKYVLVTLHRPSNVDQPETLQQVLTALEEIALEAAVIFPVHPRTRKTIQQAGWQLPNIRLLEPLGYLDFLSMTASAGLVITDSGGIQEETTYLSIPCLTVRSSTERPITISQGTNQLVSSTKDAILAAFADTWGKPVAADRCPPLWDGHTAERIVQVMLSLGC